MIGTGNVTLRRGDYIYATLYTQLCAAFKTILCTREIVEVFVVPAKLEPSGGIASFGGDLEIAKCGSWVTFNKVGIRTRSCKGCFEVYCLCYMWWNWIWDWLRVSDDQDEWYSDLDETGKLRIWDVGRTNCIICRVFL
jgi:hypothetical protein